jgi:hypothetical protein
MNEFDITRQFDRRVLAGCPAGGAEVVEYLPIVGDLPLAEVTGHSAGVWMGALTHLAVGALAYWVGMVGR